MSGQSPPTPQRGLVNPFSISEEIGPTGIVQTREEVTEKMKRKGMCTGCGQVRTHRGFHFRRRPLTLPGEVYKGHCLKCHDIDDVKRMLGEDQGGKGGASESSKKHRRKVKNRKTSRSNSDFASSDASDASSSVFSSDSSLDCASVRSFQSGESGSLTRKDHEEKIEESDSVEASDSFRPNLQDERTNPYFDVAQATSNHSIVSHPPYQSNMSATLPDILEDNPDGEVVRSVRSAGPERRKVNEEDPVRSHLSVACAQHEKYQPGSSSFSSSQSSTTSCDQALSTLFEKFDSKDFRGALDKMRRESESTTLILAGLEKLRTLVPLEASKSKSIDSSQILPPSWIKILTCIMSQHRKNATIQSEAIWTIWTILSMSFEYKTQVTSHAGVEAIVDAMTRFPTDPGVQMHGVGALSSLCSSERHVANVRLVSKSTACIFGALEYESNDGSVEEFAVRALHGLSRTPGGITQLLGERAQSLPGKILNIMSRYKTNANIQCWACSLMWILLEEITDQRQDGNPRDSENPIFSTLEDVVLLVTDAMSIYKDNEMLNEVSCGFILHCFAFSDFVESLLSTQIMSIFESVVKSMKCHPTSSTLQIYGCHIIHSFCSTCGDTESTCEMMVQLGIVDVIIRSMQDHPDDLRLQAEACGAIAFLCEGVPFLKDTISDSGVITAIANAYRLHKQSVSADDSRLLMEQACMAMSALATSSKCVAAIRSLGILDDLIHEIGVTCGADRCESDSQFTALSNVILNILTDSHKNGSCEISKDHSVTGVSLALKMLVIPTSGDELVGIINFLYFVSDNMDCVNTILFGGGKDGILSVMQSNSESAAIQEVSCRLLSRIYASVQEDTRAIRSVDEIKLIGAAMKNHRGELSVQNAACLALRNCCTAPCWSPSESIIAELFESANDVAQAAKIHSKSSVVQESACGAFWAISTTGDAMTVSIASSGGTWCIVEAMASFPNLMSLQNDACGALLNFIVQKDCLMVIGSEQGIEVIVSCLCNFYSNLEIAEKVCSIIAVISFGLPQALSIVNDHAAAVNKVIKCMFRFPQSETIQISCSETISNISLDNYTRSNIVDLGGVDRLCNAMKDHPDNPLVQEKACKAIEKIIVSGQYDCNKLGQQIIDSMKRYGKNVRIQISGIGTLFMLSASDRSNKAVIAGLGGIDAIVRPMRNHPRCAPLQELGCKMLWSLCVLETNQVAVGQCGGLQAIINSMKEHITVAEVQVEALGALNALAVLVPNKETIINCGGVDSIVGAMMLHGENEHIVKSCFTTLSNIAVNPYTNKVNAMTRAEFEAVVDSMGKLSSSEDVQLYGCRLLRNYTFTSSNVELMRRSELLPVLLQSAALNFPRSCGERARYLLNVCSS